MIFRNGVELRKIRYDLVKMSIALSSVEELIKTGNLTREQLNVHIWKCENDLNMINIYLSKVDRVWVNKNDIEEVFVLFKSIQKRFNDVKNAVQRSADTSVNDFDFNYSNRLNNEISSTFLSDVNYVNNSRGVIVRDRVHYVAVHGAALVLSVALLGGAAFHINNLKETIADKDATILEQKDNIEQLQEDLKKVVSQEEYDKLHNEYIIAVAKVAELEEKLNKSKTQEEYDSIKEQLDAAKKELDDKKAQLEGSISIEEYNKIKADLENANREIESLKKQLAAAGSSDEAEKLREMIAAKDKEIADLNTQLAKANSKYDELNNRYNKLKDENKELAKENGACKQKAAEYESQIEQLKADINAFESIKKELNDKITKLEADLKTEQGKNTANKKTIADLKKQIEELKKNLETIKETYDSKCIDYEKLLEEYESLIKTYEELMVNYGMSKEEINSLQEKVQKIEDERDRYKALLEAGVSAWDIALYCETYGINPEDLNTTPGGIKIIINYMDSLVDTSETKESQDNRVSESEQDISSGMTYIEIFDLLYKNNVDPDEIFTGRPFRFAGYYLSKEFISDLFITDYKVYYKARLAAENNNSEQKTDSRIIENGKQ